MSKRTEGLNGSITLETSNDKVAARAASAVVDETNGNESLELAADVDLALDSDIGVFSRLVRERVLGLDLEDKASWGEQRLEGLIQLVPFLALKNNNVGLGLDSDGVARLVDDLESLRRVRGRRRDSEDSFGVAEDVALCFDSLAAFAVGDRDDPGFRLRDIADLERLGSKEPS